MSITDLRDALEKEGDTVERSVLSRYVNSHGLVRRREGRKALCSFAEVRAHRRSNYDRELMGGAVLATAPSAPSVSPGEAPASSRGDSGETPPAPTPAKPDPDYSLDERRRQKRAQALQAELDLSERVGLLVERAEVEAGLAAAIGSWNRASGHAASDAADALVSQLKLPVSSAPAVRLAFKRFASTMRDRLAAECKRLAGDLGTGNETKEGAAARLDALIAEAKRLMPDPLAGREPVRETVS